MGNSNDGNTAPRFFEHSEVSARILGLDVKLVKRYHVILQVIASDFNVRVKLFEAYCHKTAAFFVSKYAWYTMSTIVHKVLIHGPKIIKSSILPIGQLSEKAQESRNNDIRNYREYFTRKFSRVKTIGNILLRLLASSDPLLSSLRNSQPNKGKKNPRSDRTLDFSKIY